MQNPTNPPVHPQAPPSARLFSSNWELREVCQPVYFWFEHKTVEHFYILATYGYVKGKVRSASLLEAPLAKPTAAHLLVVTPEIVAGYLSTKTESCRSYPPWVPTQLGEKRFLSNIVCSSVKLLRTILASFRTYRPFFEQISFFLWGFCWTIIFHSHVFTSESCSIRLIIVIILSKSLLSLSSLALLYN